MVTESTNSSRHQRLSWYDVPTIDQLLMQHYLSSTDTLDVFRYASPALARGRNVAVSGD